MRAEGRGHPQQAGLRYAMRFACGGLSMRLLLLEDNPGLAEPLVALLRREGYEVVWCSSSQQALEAFMTAEPDLAILDIMLPEGDDAGFGFAEDIRRAGYAGHILFLSARDEIDDRVRGLDIGGDDYLTKPFSIVELSCAGARYFAPPSSDQTSVF